MGTWTQNSETHHSVRNSSRKDRADDSQLTNTRNLAHHYRYFCMHTFFLQVCRSAAAFDILLSSWGSSAGKLEWCITVLFKWCISFSYVDWQERDCSNPEILFPSPSPSSSQMTSPTETSSGVHIGSCHCDCIQCTNYLFEGVLCHQWRRKIFV